MSTTIGYVTACTGKPKEGKGLWDEIWEIENYQDGVEHLVINPQDIFFEDGEFRYRERKKEDYYPTDSHGFRSRSWLPASEKKDVDFFDKFSEVDHIRIRGFRPKNSDADPFVVERALSEMTDDDEEYFMTNTLDSIEYCNNKAFSTIDISRSNAEIDGRNISDIIPTTKIFNLKNSDTEEKDGVKEYVRRRFQGAHEPQILKPYSERGGNGIMPLDIGSSYKALIDNYERSDFLVQDMVEGDSLRVQIVGSGYSESDIYGSYIRKSEDGDVRAQNNIFKEHIDLDGFQKEVSLLIHRKSGVRLSAIDYLIDDEDDNLFFLEINGENPGWKNLKRVYGSDDGLPPGADDGFVERIQETGLASYIVEDIVSREMEK